MRKEADNVGKKADTAQCRFDRTYISSHEISQRLKVTRTTMVAARRRGTLPDPISINGGLLFLWERAKVEPLLAEWESRLFVSRLGEHAR